MVKDYYKCIEAIPPTAINAVFLKDEKGDLEFKTMVKDDEYYAFKGYNHGEFGDSESPLWKETYPEQITPILVKKGTLLLQYIQRG